MIEAAAMIRSTIDRILRLKEKIDALNDDIKEVYAEAKAHGLDKAALGALVNEIRKAEKLGADRINEAATTLDMYRDAYEGRTVGTKYAPHAHTPAHAPARETNSHPAVALPDDAGNAATVPPQVAASEAGAPDPSASRLLPQIRVVSPGPGSPSNLDGSASESAPIASDAHLIRELAASDQAGHSTDDCPQAPSVGSPSVAGSAATVSLELVPVTNSVSVSSLDTLAGPSGPAPLGDFDPDDDMPAFLRRSKPPMTELTA